MVNKKVVVPAAFAVLGVFLIVVGGVLIYGFKVIIHNEIKNQVVLKNGTDTYNDWITPPVPVYWQIYVLDLQNKEEVVNGKKPEFKEFGPFTYKEGQKKVDIKFHDNGTVSYKELKTYIFDRSMSQHSENFTVTTANLLFISIVDLVRKEYSWLQDMIKFALKLENEDIFMNLTVRELLWGYRDPLLDKIDEILKTFNVSFQLPDKLGLFYGQNGTDDGLYNIYSGQDDTSSNFSIIEKWNGNSSLNYWTRGDANMINGSDGTSFPPFVDSSQPLYLYSTDLCRSIYVTYNYKRKVRGIDVLHYTPPPDLFAAYPANPANQGFCTPLDNCLPSGLLNVAFCKKGLPIVLSQPHFLNADPTIINSVIGLPPNDIEHNTVLEVEPNTGVVMNAAKRIQMNIHILNDSHYPQTKNIMPVYFPIIWLNESALIDEKNANDFKNKVQTPILVTQAVQYGLMGIGFFILICVTLYLVKRRFSKSTHEEMKPIITAVDDHDHPARV